jgi:DNA-binding MarR family transcriptional regulator
MNIVTERTIENNAAHLEQLLNELVLAFNNSRLSVLNRYNVSELDVEIIKFLVANENKKMKEVGDNFNIKLSTLTSTIDKLEKGKLVKRKNSKEDRRVIYIQPTAKGERLLADLDDLTRNLAQSMVDQTETSELDPMINGLGQILNFMNEK